MTEREWRNSSAFKHCRWKMDRIEKKRGEEKDVEQV
jgi:hypothetical protein